MVHNPTSYQGCVFLIAVVHELSCVASSQWKSINSCFVSQDYVALLVGEWNVSIKHWCDVILMGKQNYSWWNLYLCHLKHHGTQRKGMSVHGVYWVVN